MYDISGYWLWSDHCSDVNMPNISKILIRSANFNIAFYFCELVQTTRTPPNLAL